MQTLHQNIKKRRTELGLSQQELAEKAGYTDRSSIAKIEAGKVDLTQSKLKALADALQTTAAELMGDVTNTSNDVSDEDIKFALFSGDVEEITDEMYAEVKAYAEFVRQKHKKN